MTEKAKKCPNCLEFTVWDNWCYDCDESVSNDELDLCEIDDAQLHDYQSCGCEDYPCCGH